MEASAPRPFAVVTGASEGIGYEIARVLAEEGYDLLIAAEDDELESARQDLTRLTRVQAVRVDLARPEEVEMLHRNVLASQRPVDTLVLNARIGAGGSFAGGTELANEMHLIDRNVKSTVHLCKLEVERMVERNRGRILFTPPVASTSPGAHQAVYDASKSFIESFATALDHELEETDVTVSSLMPGTTTNHVSDRTDESPPVTGNGVRAILRSRN